MNLNEFKAIVAQHGDVRRDGRDFRGRCPAHIDDGRRGDLAFSEADGKILVKCWSGCKTTAVVESLGLQMKDLFTTGNGHARPATPRQDKPKRVYSTLADICEAIANWPSIRGTFSRAWPYYAADGTELFSVLRFDACRGNDGGKTYRPISRTTTGWTYGDPVGQLPLYCLPKLLENTDDVAYVVEGEKCADAAKSIGLLATTSAHGANAADKTDWKPLSARDVVILPDSDEDGDKYADEVAVILLALDPPARVKIVTMEDLWP